MRASRIIVDKYHESEAFPLVKCIQDTCRMGRWSCLVLVWLNRSTFDNRKRHLHFRSQWHLDLKFKFSALVTVVQRYVSMFPLNQNYLRLSWFKKSEALDARTDGRGATVNATPRKGRIIPQECVQTIRHARYHTADWQQTIGLDNTAVVLMLEQRVIELVN